MVISAKQCRRSFNYKTKCFIYLKKRDRKSHFHTFKCDRVFDDVRSVRSFKKSLSILTPSFVSRLHLSVKSVSSFCPFMSVVMTLILSESRSLQIVEVDSLFRPLNNCLPNNLLINVDLPALVSPEICVYNPLFVTKSKKNLNKARCVTQLLIQR